MAPAVIVILTVPSVQYDAQVARSKYYWSLIATSYFVADFGTAPDPIDNGSWIVYRSIPPSPWPLNRSLARRCLIDLLRDGHTVTYAFQSSCAGH
jgi:hypothetical protein